MSVETMDYLGMLRRMIRAGGRRVADADEVELAELLRLRGELETAIAHAVHGQHQAGRSWSEIGAACGVSKQAAAQRWGGLAATVAL